MNKLTELSSKAISLQGLMIEQKKTLSIAESCTGGLLQAVITSNPGCSEFFLGGTVVYSNYAKKLLLNLKDEILQNFGAVSVESAKRMALNTLNLFQSDYSVAITGIAGPLSDTTNKPIGLVYVAFAILESEKAIVKKFYFSGDRNEIRFQTVEKSIELLYDYMSKGEKAFD